MALEGAQGARGGRGHPERVAAGRRRGGPQGMRKITAAFVKQAKIHGVKYVCSQHYSLHHRVVWFLAFCTSLGFLISWSSNRFLYLLSFPSHTRFHMEWTKELNFPALTICNNNPIRFYQLTKSDLYYAGQWLGLLTENRTARPLVIELIKEERQQWFQKLSDFRLFLPPRTFEGISLNFMDRLGHQLDDMLLSCRYRGDLCGPQNFTSVSLSPFRPFFFFLNFFS
ncbi:hypothetical protein chiPu_0007538 [Chiloscyllium punctatum]|uniref:Uncharacterized protein n=1 Tax=Chiloscyllium punctatum TaxID=137246 RepID=A0A401SFD3_CHIPU|nr:hypothetical protein [Chiloscyllium punctatum]